jgi:hypothetical protein
MLQKDSNTSKSKTDLESLAQSITGIAKISLFQLTPLT